MNTDNGALEFDFYLNNDRLNSAISEAERRIMGLSNTAVQEGNKIDETFSKIGKLAAGYFGFEALKGFATQLVQVRGEFQQLDVAFQTMLGNKEKSDKLMAQIVDTAAKTPFTLTQVAAGAKQLLAYQVAAEDVNDTVIRLGNISAGVSVPMDRLILAYGQVKAKGKLMGDDMRQFTEAGIPMIHELAKVMSEELGKSIPDSQISKMVEAGKIGFPEVQKVIQNLTNAGGMFYNLMEKQSHTLTGEISNLQDAWDRMLNSIGESNDTVLSDIILGATSVVEHYQEIIDVITPLIATVGAYKAALIVTAVAQKAMAAATFIQEYVAMGNAVGFATANQIAFNKATLANPYALAAAALVGLTMVIYKFATSTTEAQKAHKELDSTLMSETMTLDIMFERLKNAKKGTDEYASAKEAIVQKYGQYDNMLKTELDSVQGITTAYNKLSEAVVSSAKARLRDKYTKDASDKAAEDITKEYTKIRDKLQKQFGEDAGSALFDSVKQAFESGGDYQSVISAATKKKTGLSNVNFYDSDIDRYVNKIKKSKDELKGQLKEFDQIFGDTKPTQEASKKASEPVLSYAEQIAIATKRVKEAKDKLKEIMASKVTETGITKKSEDIKSQQEAVKAAEDELSLLQKGKAFKQSNKKITPFGTLEYWTELLKKLKESITAYNSITGQAIGSSFDKKLNVKSKGVDITNQISQAEEMIKKLTYRSFDEEITYRKEQYSQYYDYVAMFGEDAAKKQFASLLSQGNSYTEYLKSKQSELQNIVTKGNATPEQIENLQKLNKAINDANGIKDPYSQFTDSISKLKDQSKTTLEYLQKLNEERAKVTGGKTNLTPEQKTQAISLIDKESSDASAKALNDLMNKYQNTQAKMLAAQKQYTSDSEMLTAKLISAQIAGDEKGVKSAQDALTQRKTDFEKEISNISVTDLMKSPDWTKLFSNLDNLTVSDLLKLKEKIEGQFKNLNLSPEDMKTVRDKINEVTGQIEKRNPFMALSDSIKNYSKDASSVNLKAVFKDVSGSIDLVKGALDEVVGNLDKMGVKLDEGDKQVLSDISGIMGGASQLAQGIATGNPLAIVQGTISVISNGIDLIAGAKDRKLERSIQKHAEAVKQLKADYEQLERAVDKALGTAVYDNQKASIENLKKQRQEYQAMMADEQSKKKSDSGKIDEYKSAITDINNQISDMLDSIKEELLGTDLKSIVKDLGSSIIDAFSSGEDAATAWGNKVNDIVGSIVKNLLLQKMETPIGNIINSYLSKWVGSDGTLLMSTDNIINQATQMGDELKSFGDNMDAILEALPDNVKKYLTDSSSSSSSSSSSLSGSVQSVTEQTADVISGQMNAIRINQIESLNTLRNQLIALNMIANNTTIHLTKLDTIISSLSNIANSNTRASGLF